MTAPPQHCDVVPGKSMLYSAKVSPTSVQYLRRCEVYDTDDDFDFGGVSCRRSIPLFCLHSLLIRQWKLFMYHLSAVLGCFEKGPYLENVDMFCIVPLKLPFFLTIFVFSHNSSSLNSKL